MNHSCWIIDAAILNVKDFDQNWSSDELDQADVRADIKRIVEDSLEIILWMNETRPILKFSFLAEFTLLSTIFCLSIYTFSSNLNESLNVVSAFMLAFSQLSVYCWMGSRIETKMRTLSSAIYSTRWENLKPKQRQDLQLVMMMVQNIGGFNGIFESVDFETFQKVSSKYQLEIVLRLGSSFKLRGSGKV